MDERGEERYMMGWKRQDSWERKERRKEEKETDWTRDKRVGKERKDCPA